ncbi:MAG: DUF6531 domain-containing protein, partial [Gammaproteobacteria bacterium]
MTYIVTRLPIAHPQLEGFRIGHENWVFSAPFFEPSYWLLLRREGFTGNLFSDSEELSRLTNRLSRRELARIYALTGMPTHTIFDTDHLRQEVAFLILKGRIKVYRISDDFIYRLGHSADPIYSNGDHAQTACLPPVEAARNRLSNTLGEAIAVRWARKDREDNAHWNRSAFKRELAEMIDLGQVVVDTLVECVTGLMDLAMLVIHTTQSVIAFQVKVLVSAAQYGQMLANGEIDRIRRDLENLGVAIGDTLDSIGTFTQKLLEGKRILETLTNDGLTVKLLCDYFNSLWESTPYRKTRTVKATVGVEVLLALATFGTASVARHSISTVSRVRTTLVKSPRIIGGFPIAAIEYIKALADALHNHHLQRLAHSKKSTVALPQTPASRTGPSAQQVSSPPSQQQTTSQSKPQNPSQSQQSSQQSFQQQHADTHADDAPASSTTSPGYWDQHTDQSGETKTGQATPAIDQTTTGGEPISLVTGEELLELSDFTFLGPLPHIWRRVYRSSNSGVDVGLGYGWTHPFSEHLDVDTARISLHNAEGRVIHFPLPEVGYRSHNTAENLCLLRHTSHAFVLTSTLPGAHLERHFSAEPDEHEPNQHKPNQHKPNQLRIPLRRIQNSFGHALNLHYHDAQLVRIDSQYDYWLLDYNDTHRLTDVTWYNPEGMQKRLVHYEYNAQGDLIRAEDAVGNAEQYAYQQHLIQQRTLKSGYRFYFEWDGDGPGARCVRNWGDELAGQPTYSYAFSWDSAHRRATVTDTRGGSQHYHFNERGLPVFHRDPEGGETRYQYDAWGNRTHITDALNHSERYEYDATQRLQSIVDKQGRRTTFTHNANGQITQISDPLGAQWKQDYNAHGQLIRRVDPLGHATHYDYNAMGYPCTVTDPQGRKWHYVWDHRGLLMAITNPRGQRTRYRYNAFGELLRIIWPDERVSAYTYDAAGNCTTIQHPDGQTETFAYNPLGLLTEHHDPTGRLTRYEYNGLSQVVRRIDPAGQCLDYHYDGERNLIGLTNEKGERHQLRYDLNERLIEEVGFDGRLQRYEYNVLGHLIASEEFHPDGQTRLHRITYTRDPDGRLLKLHVDGAERATTTYQYDPLGRLIEAKNAHRHLSWCYDPLGRVLEDRQDHHLLVHDYNSLGQRVSTSLPDRSYVRYHYDASGAFEALDYNGQRLAHIDRDAAGREIKRNLSNALSTTFAYDPQGRLIEQSTGKLDSDARFCSTSHRQYQYNASGQLSCIDDARRGVTHYHYDVLDRLTQVEGPLPEHFVHDPAGNILSGGPRPSPEPQTNTSTGNRLSCYGDAHYDYDTRGNRITQTRGTQKTHYRYNALNQLTDLIQNDVHTEYEYDP